MAVQIIPLLPLPNYRFEIILENINWQMRVRWSTFASVRRLDMSSLETSTTLYGLSLLPGSNILLPHAVSELGKMYVVDTAGQFADPNFDDIGDRFKLLYVPLEDINEYPL